MPTKNQSEIKAEFPLKTKVRFTPGPKAQPTTGTVVDYSTSGTKGERGYCNFLVVEDGNKARRKVRPGSATKI